MKLSKKTRKTLIKIVIVLISILLALLVGSIFLIMQGQDPLTAYYYLFIVPLSSIKDIVKALGKATPLIFGGLSVAVAFKCNVFNIGVEGQLYMGGIAAAFVGYAFGNLPPYILLPLCILAAVVVGAFFAYIPAILKVKLGVHEVISTIMMNYVVYGVVSWIIVDNFRGGLVSPTTPNVSDNARLSQFMPPEHLNTGFVIAIIACVVLYLIFKKTPLGWRIDAAGKNLDAARCSGMNSQRLIIVAMLISGALAGFIGAERVLGAYGYMEVEFSSGWGWDGITIAIIASNNPIGVLIMALFMGIMDYGSVIASIMTKVSTEWVNVMAALIFLFVVAGNAVFDMLSQTNKKKVIRHKGKEAEIE